MSVVAIIGSFIIYSNLAPQLPSVDSLKEVQLQTPLKVYSREGDLLAVYGEKRRKPLRYEQVPDLLVQAFLCAEDDRFFEHPGVDYQGIVRAAFNLIRTGQKTQGGSTITMQVARNFFLTNERTYERKLKEIMLALRIEQTLTKEEILELYLNKIYLGHRSYGVGAAAELYYGRSLEELSLAELAMIAGLPKAPSKFNPLTNPYRALERRNYVLGRMVELDRISPELGEEMKKEPLTAQRFVPIVEVEAPYVGEMVRAQMYAQYGEAAYSSGLSVYTTLESRRQRAASEALRKGLEGYDVRHGYRGAEGSVPEEQLLDQEVLGVLLNKMTTIGGLVPGVVVEVSAEDATVLTAKLKISLDLEAVAWAKPYKNENSVGKSPSKVSDVLQRGDIIRLRQKEDGMWLLSQVPDVAGALVSVRPQDGSIAALAGGFDFYYSKFNRATQAKRQPGSAFKPFVYSAALEAGYTPATIVNDAPVVMQDQSIEDTWRPNNYSGRFHGPTRLRAALTQSRNMVSIRVLREIGRKHALKHIEKFGFDANELPRDLTLALGSGSVTPLELASAYGIFANGGYRVEPYFIERVEDARGEILFRVGELQLCERDCDEESLNIEENGVNGAETESVDTLIVATTDIEPQPTENIAPFVPTPRIAKRVLSQANAYQMDSMMKDVIRYGTGKRALALKRSDIAGKTGTTNEQHDAWFSGYQPNLVTTVWVGFDQLRPLGRREAGGIAALPIWVDYMREALQTEPIVNNALPQGMVTLRIDPQTGLLVDQSSSGGMPETFRIDHVPGMSYGGYASDQSYGTPGTSASDSGVPAMNPPALNPEEQLF